MRIDHEYTKSLLCEFLDSPLPTLTLDKVDWIYSELGTGSVAEQVLVFHLELFVDQQIIEGLGNDKKSFGLDRCDEQYDWTLIELRLTAHGHDFASALNKPGVIEILKSTFKESGPSETVKAVFNLGIKATDKALNSLVDSD